MKEFDQYYIKLMHDYIKEYLKSQFEEDKMFRIYDQSKKCLFSGQLFMVHRGELYKCRRSYDQGDNNQHYIAKKIGAESQSIIVKLIYPNGAKIEYFTPKNKYILEQNDRNTLFSLMSTGFTHITTLKSTYYPFTSITIHSLSSKREPDNKLDFVISENFFNTICHYGKKELKYYYYLTEDISFIMEEDVK